ncbi:MAG TPA: 5-(carboxyamino)imidazole ribonucleotide synthase [Hyphomicrobiaceae bacterium]|nr:5-(carboxyamino)imidazole ribonucleotide synthase [Hyphomicrobiaceae bacterium]
MGAERTAPLPPGSTIGILGSGQLGRMLALAAARLGFRTHVYADEEGPAFDVSAQASIGAFEDLARIEAFAQSVDVVTYEFENVPLAAAAAANRIRPVRPGPKALQVAQDRLEEKRFAESLGLAVARYAPVESVEVLKDACQAVGLPAILKTRRFGYDGKGQATVAAAGEAPYAFETVGRAPSVLEARIDFAFEVSVLVVRSLRGEIAFYDIPLNTHSGGILARSVVPSPLSAEEQMSAKEMAASIAKALGYVGVLAVEMFYLGDVARPFLVNELAPRVHNSGHWTLDACTVSQFENHVRAIAGWPLGPTQRHCDAEMENLIGADVERWRELAREPMAALHIYGKRHARVGRKMGHVTRLKPRRPS